MVDRRDEERRLSAQIERKEARRLRARRQGDWLPWATLGLYGVVGWSIVLPTLAGLALGLWIDARWPGRVSWTLMLLAAGLLMGCWNAWRVAAPLADGGTPPAEVLPCPASAARITGLVGDLLERVAAWRAAGEVEGVRLYFNAPRGAAGYRPQEEILLPLDADRLRALAAEPWRPRAIPAFAGDWDALFSAVVQQHLFVTLHRALARSLASENAGRLRAMHAAERNIEDRLVALRGEFHRRRQEAVTTELLEIVSGFETLSPGLRL